MFDGVRSVFERRGEGDWKAESDIFGLLYGVAFVLTA
jgi:hypothetical protein